MILGSTVRLRAPLGVFAGLLFAALSSAQAPSSAGIVFGAPVVNVLRGDTLVVVWGGRERRLEIAEIECPTPEEPFGAEAMRRVAELVLGERVEVRLEGGAIGGGLRGHVRTPDRRDLARLLVREGLARWQGWCEDVEDPGLGRLEREARAARRGLWSLPGSEPETLPRCSEEPSSTSRVTARSEASPRTPTAGGRACVPRNRCCKVCSKGKACGNSCISRSYNCHKGHGCACDLAEICPE